MNSICRLVIITVTCNIPQWLNKKSGIYKLVLLWTKCTSLTTDGQNNMAPLLCGGSWDTADKSQLHLQWLCQWFMGLLKGTSDTSVLTGIKLQKWNCYYLQTGFESRVQLYWSRCTIFTANGEFHEQMHFSSQARQWVSPLHHFYMPCKF